MKLESVRIQHLRAFWDETVRFDDYTCLVGPNGAGKSTVLCALNIFFRENDNAPTGQDLTTLTDEDFHGRDTSKPIRITVTFGELSVEAQADFAAYVRQGRLVVTAEARFDDKTRAAVVKQYGERLVIGAFRQFFAKEKEGAKVKVPELKETYTALKEKYPDLPTPGSRPDMVAALHTYEEAHPELCELVPSSDQFYGFTNGTNLLAKYLQWVFVPAVKDAATEQVEAKNSALSKLLSRAVDAKANLKEPIDALRTKTQQEYATIVAKQEGALMDLSVALQKRLVQWSHPAATVRLEWNLDAAAVKVAEPLASVRAGELGFEGALSRLGHGLQRSYIMALLQELAGNDAAAGPRLILACEEPELYQHPPQSRYLGDVFRKLSTGNAQVVICTHSPHFVVGDHFESIRLVRKLAGASNATVISATRHEVAGALADATGKPVPGDETGALATIHQALTTSINEMFFAAVLVFVEGAEDVAYITTYLTLSELWEDWRRLGCHIIATDRKSNMLRPLAVARALRIPTFVVFDADGHKPNAYHERDNKALLTLCGDGAPTAYPAETVWKDDMVVWRSQLGDVVRGELASNTWNEVKAEAEVRYGGDLDKNALFIADTLTVAWGKNVRSPALEQLCRRMVAFAKNAHAGKAAPPPGDAAAHEVGAALSVVDEEAS